MLGLHKAIAPELIAEPLEVDPQRRFCMHICVSSATYSCCKHRVLVVNCSRSALSAIMSLPHWSELTCLIILDSVHSSLTGLPLLSNDTCVW